jgi:hypothetical protein
VNTPLGLVVADLFGRCRFIRALPISMLRKAKNDLRLSLHKVELYCQDIFWAAPTPGLRKKILMRARVS